jgi:hypothetical protein
MPTNQIIRVQLSVGHLLEQVPIVLYIDYKLLQKVHQCPEVVSLIMPWSSVKIPIFRVYFFALTGIHSSGFIFRRFFFFRGIGRSNSVRGLCRFNFSGEILKPSLLGNSYGIGLYVWLHGRSNDWFDRWFDRWFYRWFYRWFDHWFGYWFDGRWTTNTGSYRDFLNKSLRLNNSCEILVHRDIPRAHASSKTVV